MTPRTSSKTVTFMRPFSLGGFDKMLPAGRNAGPEAPHGTADPRQRDAGRRAIDRAEDEGMTVRPG